jgi:hypothetical protein
MDKILPPAVMNGRNMATAVKYGQNFVSSGKNGLIILKNVAEGALQGKMHQGPPDSKAAPAYGCWGPEDKTSLGAPCNQNLRGVENFHMQIRQIYGSCGREFKKFKFWPKILFLSLTNTG